MLSRCFLALVITKFLTMSILLFFVASLPRRGKTKCLYWKRKRDAHPTKVEIEIPPELKRIVGANNTQFISEASYLMKQLMPLDVEKWDDIQPDKKRKYFMKLKVCTVRLTLSCPLMFSK